MIKFFRKIRHDLMKQNKISKYLLYAIGEIILVVIGILIALGVNQKSQQKANEAKVDAIFEVILEDILADIEESTTIINTIHGIDSISHHILNTALQKKRLSNIDFPIITYTNLFNFTEGGYQNLSQNLDILPEKYITIIKDLNFLYNARKESVQYWDNVVNEQTHSNEEYLVNTFDWYANPSIYQEKQNDLLTDFKYKNRVHAFQGANLAWLNSVHRHRNGLITNYQKIAELLGKPILHDNFKVDENIADLFVGEWKATTDQAIPNNIFSYRNGRLFHHFKDDPDTITEVFIGRINKDNNTYKIQTVVPDFFSLNTFSSEGMIISMRNPIDKGYTIIRFVKVD